MTTTDSQPDPRHVVVAGGGVAALETMLALRDLAGDRVRVLLLAPDTEFVYRPLSVGDPFALGSARRYPLSELVHTAGARLTGGRLAAVDPARRTLRTDQDEELAYDDLVVAIGARPQIVFEHAT